MKYVHTNIIARDWAALADFYVRVFECVPQPPKRKQSGEWLEKGTGVTGAQLEGMHLRLPGYDADGPTLEIFRYSEMVDKGRSLPNQRGLGHLAFRVEDVATVQRRALAHGATALGEISEHEVAGVGHLTFVYLADPEGNIIELQHWS